VERPPSRHRAIRKSALQEYEDLSGHLARTGVQARHSFDQAHAARPPVFTPQVMIQISAEFSAHRN
jgi:hypothetical protein